MQEYTTIERNGLTAKIFYDTDPQDPREWEPASTMACFHNRYRLGDDHDFSEPEDLVEFVNRKDVVALPLYLYDHSGITMSTSPFGCRWDSGQVGYIYMTYDEIRKEHGWTRITKARYDQVVKWLKGEVEVYDQYLTGEVYGFVIEDADGEELDACWGFYGDKDVEREVNSLLDYYERTLPRQYALEV
jgi:hypothetical protein